MTQPLNRDELARNLYIGVPLGPEAVRARATEWDEGMVSDDDRTDCYAHADRMIAEGQGR